jgi:hypothetical protein
MQCEKYYNRLVTYRQLKWDGIINIVAYLLHARTVEPQKQQLLSNARTQQ